MQEKGLISIVVPIYNTAAYLEKCLDSIINQTYKNIEILLINNITCADTEVICNKYALLDNRISVINVPNIPVGAARNIGIEKARGEYIGFVDSDDYIEKDMFEVLLKNIIQYEADISMVGFCYEVDGKIVEKKFTNKIEILDKPEALKEVLKDKKIQSFVWNKLFKRELLEKNRFMEDRVFEDIDLMYKIIQGINKIVCIDSHKYIYVQRGNSIMHIHNSQNIMDRLNVVIDRYNNINNTESEEYDFINSYAFAVNMIVIYRSIVLNKYDDIYEQFMKHLELFMSIINKFEDEIRKILTSNQNIVLDLMLEDINTAPDKIRAIKDIDK